MSDLIHASGRERFLWKYYDSLDSDLFQCYAPLHPQQFHTEVHDEGDCYVLTAKLPGFRQEEIFVGVEQGHLVIRAQHRHPKGYGRTGYLHRHTGNYYRAFDVKGIDTGRLDARYADGVLTLTCPKLVAKEKRVPVH